MDTQLILSTPPEYLKRAVEHEKKIAHMAYQIGDGFHLYRANVPLALQGGLMVLGDNDYNGNGNVEALASEISKECIQRGFDGVVMDFESVSPLLHSLVALLSSRLKRQGIQLYLPERYADDSDWARILISTAISSGSLSARLNEVVRHYGIERIALEIQRISIDFCLPSQDRKGKPLSALDLYTLTKTFHPQSYFSQELCAYYFTFQDKEGSHFVLYDNAGSIRKKILLAEYLNIHCVMLFYPEVEDIIDTIKSGLP